MTEPYYADEHVTLHLGHDGAACQIQLLCDVDRQAALVDIARIHAAERTPACSVHMQPIDVTWRRL